VKSQEDSRNTITINGFCENRADWNGDWQRMGNLQSGAPYYYKSDAAVPLYLYWDPNCDGAQQPKAAWIFASQRPSITDAESLGVSGCHALGDKSPVTRTWNEEKDIWEGRGPGYGALDEIDVARQNGPPLGEHFWNFDFDPEAPAQGPLRRMQEHSQQASIATTESTTTMDDQLGRRLQADYKLGETFSVECPAGYSKIYSSEDCKAAAGELGIQWLDIDYDGVVMMYIAFGIQWHPVCFEDTIFGAVLYDPDDMPTDDAAPLCKLEATAASTEAPT
jgi:hypothetical protein